MEWLYFILLWANIIGPIVESIVLEYCNWTEKATGKNLISDETPFWFWAFTLTRYSTGFLQLVSGIFLLVAVAKIRSFLVSSGLSEQCNY